MMYNKIVANCFFMSQHVGLIDLTDPFVVHFRGNQKNQSVVTDLYMQCTKNGSIAKVCFKTNGNPYVIAALEWIGRQTEGVMFDELVPVTYQELIEVLEIPATQYPVALHIEDIYKEVLILMKKKLEGNHE